MTTPTQPVLTHGAVTFRSAAHLADAVLGGLWDYPAKTEGVPVDLVRSWADAVADDALAQPARPAQQSEADPIDERTGHPTSYAAQQSSSPSPLPVDGLEPAGIQFEIWQDDIMVAACDRSGEAEHYAAVYAQDGPVTLKHSVTWRYDGFDAPSQSAADALEAANRRIARVRAEAEAADLRKALSDLLAAVDEVGVRHWDGDDNCQAVEDVIFCSDRARQALAAHAKQTEEG